MPALSTFLGALAGLVLTLSVAFVTVIAVNGVNNPGVAQASQSAAGGASASPWRQHSGSGSFDALDINEDGKLSLAEAAGYSDIVTRFERADRNKDGRLTKAEFERLAKLPPAKARPKTRLQLRQDAAAALAASREGQ